jgi:hypothetical protein
MQSELPNVRRLVRGASILAATAAILFVFRLLLRPSLVLVTPEECHTGGIATEILHHGFRFPLLAYTPEHYENGIILQGLAAIPFFAVFGANVLALKLLSLVASTAVLLLGWSLLESVLRENEGQKETSATVIRVVYLVLLLLAPTWFVYESLDALGDENEATALSMALFVLLARRMTAPSTLRTVTLWCCAGFFAFLHKGTLLVSALAGLYELNQWWRSTARLRHGGRVLFPLALGASPAIYAMVRSGFSDFATVGSKFQSPGLAASARAFFGSTWKFFDQNAPLTAIVVASFLWATFRAFRQRRLTLSVLLGLYSWAHLGLMWLALPRGHFDYFHYGYPVMALWAALGIGALWSMASRFVRGSRLQWSLPVGLVVLLGCMTIPSLRVWSLPQQTPRLLRLLGEKDRAVCSWRFGRAFLRTAPDPGVAADWCRLLDTPQSLDCLAGLGFERQELARGSPEERQAWAFGRGREITSHSSSTVSCSNLQPDAQQSCEAGAQWECLAYLDLISSINMGLVTPRPACPFNSLPYAGAAQGWAHEWALRPEPDPNVQLPIPDSGECSALLARCFPPTHVVHAQ